MVVTASKFIADVVLFIRNFLRTNITDPLNRTNGIGFVMTSFPKRAIQYPVIVVRNSGIETRKLGMQSEKQWVTFTVEVKIFARNSKEVDSLTQSVIHELNQNIYGSGSTNEEEIFGFKINSVVPIVEETGDNTIHQKVISVEYKVII